MPTHFWLFAFGIAIGVASGLFGIGGGILLVPGLIILFGFSQQQAQGTSLAVMVPPIGIFAAWVYHRHGFIDLPVVGWVAAGFALGGFLGAYLIAYVPIPVLRLVFGSLLLYVGFLFVFNPTNAPRSAALPAGFATMLFTMLAPLIGKRMRQSQEPPQNHDKDIDYHI